MANNFLSKFRSGLKEVQGRQLQALLSREKIAGTITTVEEFKARLSALTAKLNSSIISPSLELYFARIGEYIDSESLNSMLQNIEDDLKVAFLEANDIDEVLSIHESIINEAVIKNLEFAINDIETKIQSLEFINKTFTGLDNAVFNTFRASQNSRSSFNEGVIFFDPKSKLSSRPENEASIDFIGEKLLLKSDIETSLAIASIRQIFDSEAKGSELKVDFESSKLSNILDRTLGTFWVQSVLQSKPQGEAGILTKLELNLGAVSTINYLHLEPLFLSPLELHKISYLDGNNKYIDILTTPIDIQTTNKLFFDSISTKTLLLQFRNRHFIETQFEIKPESPLISITRDNPVGLVASAKFDLDQVISSPRLRELIGLNSVGSGVKKRYYEYLIGFDNIEVGLNKFQDTSIFLSKTEKVMGCGQFSFKVLDKRPVSANLQALPSYTEDTQPSDFTNYFHASTEYYLVKRDFKEDGTLLNSFTVPVLPLNINVIRHERLLLNNKSATNLTTNDIGTLQFFTSESISDIKVYRNSLPLTPTDLVTINPLETDGWLIDDDNTFLEPNQKTRMKVSIRIQRPNPVDIYTVSYTPDTGDSIVIPKNLVSTSATVVDLNGLLDAWLIRDNTILFPDKKNGSAIDYSLLNIAIVLRRNTSNVTLTPVVEEFLFATGTKNIAKFGD